MTSSSAGKARRLKRLFSHPSGRVVFVPIDDGLISGPFGGLHNLADLLSSIAHGRPDGLIAFPGPLRNYSQLLLDTPTVLNATASTTLSQHTHKRPISTVLHALSIGADAVAVHVNISSPHEGDMLRTLSRTAAVCDTHGVPLLCIVYPRTHNADGSDNNYDVLRRDSPERYTDLVAHACRVSAELGADLIKTQYTGDAHSFRRVVDACRPVPVIIAGGPKAAATSVFTMALDALSAGAAGVSFGRNVFLRQHPSRWIEALKMLAHDNRTLHDTLAHVSGHS